MLTFEMDGQQVLEVNFDAGGRDQLLLVLQRIELGDHEHLLASSWGGDALPEHLELSEDFPNADLLPVMKVTFQFLDPWPTRTVG